jgi:membrane protease YdiL (CAAX protease family)
MARSTGAAHRVTTALSRRVHDQHRRAPIRTALLACTGLAALRIAGAWSSPLMVLSVAATPGVLAMLPRSQWATAGLCRCRTSPGRFLIAAVAVLASYAVSALACTAAFGVGGHNWLGSLRPVRVGLSPGRGELLIAMTALVVMGLLVPAAEEVCYRGVLHEALGRRWSPAAVAVATAAGWALAHLGDYGLRPWDPLLVAGMLPSVFLMGLALSWLRRLSGSVVACVVAQGVANLALTAWVFATF